MGALQLAIAMKMIISLMFMAACTAKHAKKSTIMTDLEMLKKELTATSVVEGRMRPQDGHLHRSLDFYTSSLESEGQQAADAPAEPAKPACACLSDSVCTEPGKFTADDWSLSRAAAVGPFNDINVKKELNACANCFVQQCQPATDCQPGMALDEKNEFCTNCGECVQMICGNPKYQWSGSGKCSEGLNNIKMAFNICRDHYSVCADT